MYDSLALYNRINNIPIYLVTTNQSTHRIHFQEMGQTIYVDVPEDRFADVHCSLHPRYPDDVIKSNSEKCVISDLLGVYVSQFKSKSSPGFAEKKSEIFLWVDKINLWSVGDYYYKPLIKQVLVHELAHAIMDVHEYPFFNPDYHLFREESLANALSLYIMGKIYKHDSNNYKFLVEFVSKQPLQYALGLLYNDKLTITSAMGHWMEIKAFNAPNNSLLPEWVDDAVSLLGSISRPLNSLENIPDSIFDRMKKTDSLLW
jgi:predicted Zn-dependent protease with MMP-like domain